MTKSIDFSYTCFNDCRQTGCPTHHMKLIYEGTSDTIRLIEKRHKDSHGEWINDKHTIYDRNELRALLIAFSDLMGKG